VCECAGVLCLELEPASTLKGEEVMSPLPFYFSSPVIEGMLYCSFLKKYIYIEVHVGVTM
jgi:hypothetical protein